VLFALDGGIDLKKTILTVSIAAVLVALISSSMAAIPQPAGMDPAGIKYDGIYQGQTYSGYETRNTTFDFEQSVQGNGYFMTYMYAKSGNIAFKNYAHGSGSINNEATLSYYKMSDKKHNNYLDYNDFYQNCIQFKEDNAMVYAPMRIAVGTGYYAANPLDYSSLLKERTEAKNYRGGTSMLHEVEYAHALDKELDVTLKEKVNYTWDPVFEGVGYTQMKVVEDVTDGKAHFGVLQANTNAASMIGSTLSDVSDSQFANMKNSAWRKPDIEIDEDYWGTYHIEKNMTLEVPYYKKTVYDDWLPCCFGGFDSMAYVDKKIFKSATGVFDCTCFKAPTQAQFPRIY
jgi:hypothetical protein